MLLIMLYLLWIAGLNFNLHFECKASDLRGIIEILEFNITLLLNNNSNHYTTMPQPISSFCVDRTTLELYSHNELKTDIFPFFLIISHNRINQKVFILNDKHFVKLCHNSRNIDQAICVLPPAQKWIIVSWFLSRCVSPPMILPSSFLVSSVKEEQRGSGIW